MTYQWIGDWVVVLSLGGLLFGVSVFVLAARILRRCKDEESDKGNSR